VGGTAGEVGRRRPGAVAATARGNGEEGTGLDNKRPCEVHRGLGNLGEWSAGGEHERGGELTAAAAMAGGVAGMARGGENDRLL
jgi:hypothetical protein